MKRISLVATLTMLVAATAAAQNVARRVFAGAPAASWIAPPGVAGDAFVVFQARRAIDLPSRPQRFVVHASGDNLYRLYVNGEQVSSGPQRADVMHWRYETVDLAPRLRAGRNVIAALVWNWGSTRPLAQHSHRSGFLLQGDGESEAIANTGPGWKLRVDSSYAFVPVTWADVRGYYAAAPAERMDGARYRWGWERVDHDDASWFTIPAPQGNRPLGAANGVVGALQLHGVPGGGGHGEVSGWLLEPRDIPPMEETLARFAAVRRSEGIVVPEAFVRGGADLVIPARSRASVLLDQGHTTNAYPVVVTSGGSGSTLALTYAEALMDSAWGKGNRNEIEGRTVRGVRDQFTIGGGERRRMQTLFWRSFRYVQVDVETQDEPLRIHDVHGIFTAYPFRERGRFAGDQPWIADVWRMNWNGARIGAFDTYMDTPYYEQLQYIGDTRIQALISLYVSGDDRLMRQALIQFDASRLPEGITTSRYPSALMQLIPPFSLFYVGMVYDYHMHRDDPAFVRARLAGIRGVLDWYGRHVDSTGMLGPMPYWNYMDWTPRWPRGVPPGADDGHSASVSLLYAYALRLAAAIETDAGVPGVGAMYRARSDSVVRATRARTWDAKRGLFRDAIGSHAYSQQTNILAILSGAVPVDDRAGVMNRVLADTTLTPASYYFGFYLLEALREAGLGERYVAHLAPWREMLALGLTSAPEKPEPTRSDTHAWSAHPNYGLLATVLGVRPSSAGFRTVHIAPALGSLRRAEGRVPHSIGDIDVSLMREGASGLRAQVTLPPGVTGTFEWGGRRTPLRAGTQVVRR